MAKNNVPKAVIFDLDGTLADVSCRRKIIRQNPKAWEEFFMGMEADPPNHPIVELFKALEVSGLYSRMDHLVKLDILNSIRYSGVQVAFVVDDRESVVRMWRENGVTCLQCDNWID